MASTLETPRSVGLGVRIRDARKRAGLTQEQLAQRLQRSHSHVSRWETGKLELSEGEAGAICGVLGITGEERDELLQMVREAADPNWLAPGVDRQLAVLADYETNAETIINVQPLILPGLLQTADYARAVIMAGGASRGEADQRVMYRLARRDVLTRSDPVNYVGIIGEHAIRHIPCAPAVAVDQLRHLLRLTGQHPNVTIQVLSLTEGYNAALEGSFVLIETATSKPIVHLEHYRSSITLTDEKDVRDYKLAAEQARRNAMSPAATTELIAQLADNMERTT